MGTAQTNAKPKGKGKTRTKALARKGAPNALAGDPSQALARQQLSLPERIEKVVMEGDLKVLSVEDRLQYVKALCHGLGIDWRTRPFAYINLNGQMVLYALRSCTDQLRRVHGISVTGSKRTLEGDLTIVEVTVRDRTGRTDTGTGAWPTVGLKGEAAVNALLKAETKAKRRATLSIAGLGILDVSELDTIEFDEVSASGRVVEIQQPATAELPEAERKWKEREAEGMEKLTPAQREVVARRMAQQDPLSRGQEGAEPATPHAKVTPVVDPAPSEYIGITFTALPAGGWEISGLTSLMREHRELIKKALNPKMLPKLVGTNEACGWLMAQLEKAGVKCRMVGDGGS